MPDRCVLGGPSGSPSTRRAGTVPPVRRPGHRKGRDLIDEIAVFLQVQPPKPDSGDVGGARPVLRVLLPYSGSDVADFAIEAMIELAPLLTSEVRVLHVREFDDCRGARFYRRPQQEALALTHDAVVRLRKRAVAATGIVRSARREDVARAILAEAEASNASMILVAAHARRTPLDLLRHDVVRYVLRRSSRPVTVVNATRPPKGSGTSSHRGGSPGIIRGGPPWFWSSLRSRHRPAA
jgi:nucleotide-binding universal stress UspA family protein